MKYFTLFVASTLFFTSCVSSKKYSELQSKLEQYESSGAIAETTTKDQKMQIDASNAQIEEMETEIRSLIEKMAEIESQQAVGQFADMNPEQLAMAERKMMEDRHNREMQMHENMANQEFDQMVSINARQLQSLKTTLTGALSYYSEPEVSILDKGSKLLVLVSDKLLFDENKTRLSAQGETFMNRMYTALKEQDDRPYKILGITGATLDDNLETASNKAMLVAKNLNSKGALKQMQAVGAQACNMSASGRNSACDRIEIEFTYDYDQILQQTQFGGR